MLNAEDKLDGTKYPTCAYMMRHVLVAKQLWNIVIGSDERPASSSSPNFPSPSRTTETNNASSSTPQQSTSSQRKWDGRDAQVHALIALSVRRHILPYIRSWTTSKIAWNVLTDLYAQRNEARVVMLKRQLEKQG